MGNLRGRVGITQSLHVGGPKFDFPWVLSFFSLMHLLARYQQKVVGKLFVSPQLIDYFGDIFLNGIGSVLILTPCTFMYAFEDMYIMVMLYSVRFYMVKYMSNIYFVLYMYFPLHRLNTEYINYLFYRHQKHGIL